MSRVLLAAGAALAAYYFLNREQAIYQPGADQQIDTATRRGLKDAKMTSGLFTERIGARIVTNTTEDFFDDEEFYWDGSEQLKANLK